MKEILKAEVMPAGTDIMNPLKAGISTSTTKGTGFQSRQNRKNDVSIRYVYTLIDKKDRKKENKNVQKSGRTKKERSSKTK